MPSPDSATRDPSSIADVLDKNKVARETVKEAAEDLAVVHTVLEAEMPLPGRTDDLHQAVAQTERLHKKLDDTADVLQEVNEALASEATVRGTRPSTS